MTISALSCSLYNRANEFSGIISSASTKLIYSPFAFSTPYLRAAVTPSLFLWNTVIRLSFCWYFWQMEREESCDPSSISYNSKFLKVWESMLSIHDARNFSAL